MYLTYNQILIALLLRYILVAGICYCIFYFKRSNKFIRLKIQNTFPSKRMVLTEILYSTFTITMLATLTYLLLFTDIKNHTRVYNDFKNHGYMYFALSIFLAIIIHDTYFYWTHRFMHWKPVFKLIHTIHHKSTNPTPMAAFSFHPLEAVIEISILPVIVFIIPIHYIALMIFAIIMVVVNVIGHLGYELYPKWFLKRCTKYINTSTHHNMHHYYGKKNYGLYFNIWDRIMRTNHPKYKELFRTRGR